MTSESITETFELRFGSAPSGVWTAPGRVNLIGEHTDYNQGLVLPLAIQYRARVAAQPTTNGKLSVHSQQLGDSEFSLADLKPQQLSGWATYAAGAVWAVGRHLGKPVSGLELAIDSDVPVGAGLSSSAAIECAVALAAAQLAGTDLDPLTLARLAHQAEYEFVGVPCGTMDQTISACGQAGSALLIDCQSGAQTPVELTWAQQDLQLVVIDTRAAHRLVDGEYAERRRTCEEAARALNVPSLRACSLAELTASAADLSAKQQLRARHVVTENARVVAAVECLRQGNFNELGKLLTASHLSLRDDFQVTVGELDVAVEVALKAGALGARMTGAGFGGCVLTLCRTEQHQELESAIYAEFQRRGFARPQLFVALASDGARRLLPAQSTYA